MRVDEPGDDHVPLGLHNLGEFATSQSLGEAGGWGELANATTVEQEAVCAQHVELAGAIRRDERGIVDERAHTCAPSSA